MEIVVRDDNGNEQVLSGLDVESLASGVMEMPQMNKLSSKVAKAVKQLQSDNGKESGTHPEMEKQQRKVQRDRARPNPSWKDDPGINSPQDYV
jgi:hypothetical protein